MDSLPWVLGGTRIIGWTLLHLIWQGVLLGLIYKIAKAMVPRGEARYRLGMIMLVALAICPLITSWCLLRVTYPAIQSMPDIAAATMHDRHISVGTSWVRDSVLEAFLPWMVLIWACGVLLLVIRAWRQWKRVQMLVYFAEIVPQWELKANLMAKRFGLHRHIRVLCSKLVVTPILVGWLKPVVLLPLALVCNFPAAQIELIVAHELAHLRRWDPVANLFQVMLETLCFYHPVVHWISREVRNEREICCDATALAISGGSRHEFAKALAVLGGMREQHGALLLAASGGVLLDRVQQMVVPPADEPAYGRLSARFVAVLVGAMLVVFTLKLEWNRAQIQTGLAESIEKIRVNWAAQVLPLMQPMQTMRWKDLAPSTIVLMRPVKSEAVFDADPLVKPQRTDISKQALVVPTPSPVLLRIADLKNTIGPEARFSNAPIAENLPMTPVAIHMQRPVYPQVALLRGIEGRVVVEFSVATDGSVQNMRIVSAEPEGIFDQSALHAMRGWKYAAGAGFAQKRYRQAVAFTLRAESAKGTQAYRQDREQIQAETGCRVPTGTHICRWPGSDQAMNDVETISDNADH
jgi:bla regulator protein BlaR1